MITLYPFENFTKTSIDIIIFDDPVISLKILKHSLQDSVVSIPMFTIELNNHHGNTSISFDEYLIPSVL